jgi:peptidoglycan L-alanyl-D-glutamate endopeptidase CwlK
MLDNITIQRIETLHPKIRTEVKNIYTNEIVPALTSCTCRFAYTLRTFKEQDDLYTQGRTKLFDSTGKRLGIVTKAKGGQSIHNYGLALDIVLLINNSASWDTIKDYDKDGKSDWMEVVNIMKNHGYTWGGDWKFKDAPHFEKTGYEWRMLLDKYNKKDFISGTTYLNI